MKADRTLRTPGEHIVYQGFWNAVVTHRIAVGDYERLANAIKAATQRDVRDEHTNPTFASLVDIATLVRKQNPELAARLDAEVLKLRNALNGTVEI